MNDYESYGSMVKRLRHRPFTAVTGVQIPLESLSGCGSAWLERLVWDQEVAGSNPVTPTDAGVVQW